MTNGLVKCQTPHLSTGSLGREERDWMLYLHPLQMQDRHILTFKAICISHQFLCMNVFTASGRDAEICLCESTVRCSGEEHRISALPWSVWSMRNYHSSERRMLMSFSSSTAVQKNSPTFFFYWSFCYIFSSHGTSLTTRLFMHRL